MLLKGFVGEPAGLIIVGIAELIIAEIANRGSERPHSEPFGSLEFATAQDLTSNNLA